MIFEFDKKPKTDGCLFIASNATIIGDVILGKNSSVWFGAVIRGDESPIRIGDNVNIQDNCVLHVSQDDSLNIGNNVTIGHNAIVHGCTVEDNCIIAMGAVILNRAHIGAGSIIGAGAVVTENAKIPSGSVVIGAPARVIKQATPEHKAKIEHNWKEYVELAKKYKERFKP